MRQFPENIKNIRLKDFHYELPPDQIAQHPLEKRDEAKLILYNKGNIAHHAFFDLPSLLEKGDLIVFNNTKVIHARMYFRRATGALIEILLLHPRNPSLVAQAVQTKNACTWHCVIGRKKRWKEGEVLEKKMTIEGKEISLFASWADREQDYVKLDWEGGHYFSEILEESGVMPLPPYIARQANIEDESSYQTIYAQHKGAAAAPTAGLHFTENVLEGLAERGVQQSFLTLHVSAGTFLPVKTEEIIDHEMHAEQFVIDRSQIEALLPHIGKIIPVGTTSLRLLESLYWLGLKVLKGKGPSQVLGKLEPYGYDHAELPDAKTALKALLDYMVQRKMRQMVGETRIFIMPGYGFKLCKGLITNFHMPGTTLILLVAALIGEDWRKVYEAALANGYRFLSYGDSSLLLP